MVYWGLGTIMGLGLGILMWKVIVAYYPQAAGMMGRYNVVLKQGL